MGSDFITKIGEIAEVFDGPHATPKKIDTGPYFLSISSLENGQLDLSKSAHLSEEQFVKWTKRVTPREGDVLFSYETRLGEAALMPGGVKACLGRRMGLLRPNLNKVLPEYLLYAYLSPAFQSEIKKRTNHGATVERISLKELPDFEVRIPALSEQKSTVKVLKALNEKIALNNQINQTLEQMAQTLFKSWFVDFDPVIDNALDAGSYIPEIFEARVERRKAVRESADFKPLPDDVRQLFPSEFEESELGWVPKGWTVVTLKSLSEKISKGTTPSKKDLSGAQDEASIKFIKVKDINDRGEVTREQLEIIPRSIHENKLKRSILEAEDILFSIAGTIGRVAILDNELNNVNTNQAVAFIRLKDKKRLVPLIYMTLRASRLQQKAMASIVQGVQANLSLTNIGEMEVVVPSSGVLNFWNKQCSSFLNKSKRNLAQSRALTTLRDTLLPKLISGELRLDSPEVEQAKALVD